MNHEKGKVLRIRFNLAADEDELSAPPGLFHMGDILHIPRTKENFLVRDIVTPHRNLLKRLFWPKMQRVRLGRYLGGCAKGEAIRDSDEVWLLGNVGQEPQDGGTGEVKS